MAAGGPYRSRTCWRQTTSPALLWDLHSTDRTPSALHKRLEMDSNQSTMGMPTIRRQGQPSCHALRRTWVSSSSATRRLPTAECPERHVGPHHGEPHGTRGPGQADGDEGRPTLPVPPTFHAHSCRDHLLTGMVGNPSTSRLLSLNSTTPSWIRSISDTGIDTSF